MSNNGKVADILHQGLKAWTNRRLYRSTAVCERLMHLLDVQAPVTNQFSGEHQYRNLVSEAHACGRVGVDIDHLERIAAYCGDRGEFDQQLLTQAATRARVQHEARRGIDRYGCGYGRGPCYGRGPVMGAAPLWARPRYGRGPVMGDP